MPCNLYIKTLKKNSKWIGGKIVIHTHFLKDAVHKIYLLGDFPDTGICVWGGIYIDLYLPNTPKHTMKSVCST